MLAYTLGILKQTKPKQTNTLSNAWSVAGSRMVMSFHVIPPTSVQKDNRQGLNLTNLKLLKLGNAVEDFGNAMYWRGGAATPSSPASSAQAGLKPAASHTREVKTLARVAPWGHRCGEKKAPTQHMNPKKTKREEVLSVLARVQLPLLPAARCVVPHLSVFIWIQPKELEPNQKPGYAPVMAQSNYKK